MQGYQSGCGMVALQINKVDISTAKTRLAIATKSLVFLFINKQKMHIGKPTQAPIAGYITAKIGRTGLMLMETVRTPGKSF